MQRVVALVVVCEFDKQIPGQGGGTSLHFKFTEYAQLQDGMRVFLRDDRGYTSGPLTIAIAGKYVRPNIDPWARHTAEEIERSVLAAIDPDDPHQAAQEIVDRLAAAGIRVDVESVCQAEWHVELDER